MLASTDLREIITISQDNSTCISSLTFVRNMKRLEGLELIEYLSANISINFDFLMRKGFFQYTHSEMSNKLDLIKDYEDEALNMNFIMPEERAKQKQQMISHINSETFNLTEVNDKEFGAFKQETGQAKEDIAKVRENLITMDRRMGIEKDKIKEEMFAKYLQKHTES